jgi:myosin heavy subunit
LHQAEWNLQSAQDYTYLNQSGCFTVNDIKDGEEFRHTRKAMSVVGMTEDEQKNLFRVVAIVLHLGNVTLKEEGSERSAVSARARNSNRLAVFFFLIFFK